MQWLAIVILSVLLCITYGVLHDQVTARVCIEYFTIGHPHVIDSEDPTVLAIVWGVLATWWVGVLLGVPLAISARIGSRPKRSVGSLFRPLALLFVATAAFALLAGCLGHLAATMGWVKLVGPISNAVPPDRHVPYITDLWTHNASYVAGIVGGIVLMVTVWRSRHKLDEST